MMLYVFPKRCLLAVDSIQQAAVCGRSPYDKILLVGDPYQIPAVLSRTEEAKHGDYSVFVDVEGPHLTQVMRNSGGVLRAATIVREERLIPEQTIDEGGSVYDFRRVETDDEALGLAIQAWLDDREDHVLLTWRNEARMFANKIIRKQIGRTSPLPELGEEMVLRKNVFGFGMNGDLVEVVEWVDRGPTLAGVETRHVVLRLDGRTRTLLVPVGDFSGMLPYVGLDVWRRALADADVDEPVPLTWSYVRTGHMGQGSEWRRVTTFLLHDLTNPNFRKMTRLPDGSERAFAWRFLYTAISRAQSRASLIVSG